MFQVVRFWLERGVDGFRIDVAHFIMKDPQLQDNPIKKTPSPSMHKSMGEYDRQIHLYDYGHPEIHEIYRQLRRLLDEYSRDHPRFAIGEVHIFDWEKWAVYYGEQLDELHMPFNFQLLGVRWEARSVRHVVDTLEGILPIGAWPNYVLGNHDENRLASRLGSQAARSAAMLLLTLRGTPTLYYGDEIGMTQADIPPDTQQDPLGLLLPGSGRDGCRTPMQWDASPHAGFSAPETPKTWLPVSQDYQTTNVVNQLADPFSILNLYRWLLSSRRNYPALQIGDYLPIDGVPEHCFAYLRRLRGSPVMLILLNFSTENVDLNLPDVGIGKMILSTYMDRSGNIDLANLRLRGDEGLLIQVQSEA
jgi:alpha-glucosidase